MAKTKTTPVVMKNKNNKIIGTINMNEIMLNRAGKVNSGTYPSLNVKIHKSKKDYDRKAEKQKLRRMGY